MVDLTSLASPKVAGVLVLGKCEFLNPGFSMKVSLHFVSIILCMVIVVSIILCMIIVVSIVLWKKIVVNIIFCMIMVVNIICLEENFCQDRIVKNILEKAEQSGNLEPGGTV